MTTNEGEAKFWVPNFSLNSSNEEVYTFWKGVVAYSMTAIFLSAEIPRVFSLSTRPLSVPFDI